MMEHPTIERQITFLYTRDLKTTSYFYEYVIGLELILDQGTCRIYRICSGGYLGFCEQDGAKTEHEDIIFTLVTNEVDRWHRYLLSRGVEMEQPPVHNPAYNIYHLKFRDPNGYLLEIQRFDNPAWDGATR